jgi:hypothetical protein
MASRELDEYNEAYDDVINRRLFLCAIRKGKCPVAVAKHEAYRDLVRTHNLDGDGLTRPRKVRRA